MNIYKKALDEWPRFICPALGAGVNPEDIASWVIEHAPAIKRALQSCSEIDALKAENMRLTEANNIMAIELDNYHELKDENEMLKAGGVKHEGTDASDLSTYQICQAFKAWHPTKWNVPFTDAEWIAYLAGAEWMRGQYEAKCMKPQEVREAVEYLTPIIREIISDCGDDDHPYAIEYHFQKLIHAAESAGQDTFPLVQLKSITLGADLEGKVTEKQAVDLINTVLRSLHEVGKPGCHEVDVDGDSESAGVEFNRGFMSGVDAALNLINSTEAETAKEYRKTLYQSLMELRPDDGLKIAGEKK